MTCSNLAIWPLRIIFFEPDYSLSPRNFVKFCVGGLRRRSWLWFLLGFESVFIEVSIRLRWIDLGRAKIVKWKMSGRQNCPRGYEPIFDSIFQWWVISTTTRRWLANQSHRFYSLLYSISVGGATQRRGLWSTHIPRLLFKNFCYFLFFNVLFCSL